MRPSATPRQKSASSSAQSSRTPTPIPIRSNATLPTKKLIEYAFCVILFGLSAALACFSWILTIENMNFSYCTDGEKHLFCEQCPDHAKCTDYDFTCYQGFFKFHKICVRPGKTITEFDDKKMPVYRRLQKQIHSFVTSQKKAVTAKDVVRHFSQQENSELKDMDETDIETLWTFDWSGYQINNRYLDPVPQKMFSYLLPLTAAISFTFVTFLSVFCFLLVYKKYAKVKVQ